MSDSKAIISSIKTWAKGKVPSSGKSSGDPQEEKKPESIIADIQAWGKGKL